MPVQRLNHAVLYVRDVPRSVGFYRDTLGLDVTDAEMGQLSLTLPGGGWVLVYPKPDHSPATYTVLNLEVSDIDDAVTDLMARGVEMTRYEGFEQDELGIARGIEGDFGPDIAWFTDPAGNILSVLENPTST